MGEARGGTFRYSMPARVHFGPGRIEALGEMTAGHGTRALLVTGPRGRQRSGLVDRCRSLLEKAGLKVTAFDGVQPNPGTDVVASAAALGRKGGCDVVVGVGGGSAMDVAKAAAVEITHPLPCFEYAYFQPQQPGPATLPLVLATTTSGTGSHVSKCSVVTHAEKRIKTGIVSDHIFAREAIVDPELMLSMPPVGTADTGFDVFTHAFESFVNKSANALVDQLALGAIRLFAEALPVAVRKAGNLAARSAMATADTLAGTCIANVGTTLPHSLAQPVSGHFPAVTHGRALAWVYPAFLAWTWPGSEAKFAVVARIFDPSLAGAADRKAAEALAGLVRAFLHRIGITDRLGDVPGVRAGIGALIKEALDFPDTYANPVVPDGARVRALYEESM